MEKVEAEVLLLPQDRAETGLRQLVILLEADAETLPQKASNGVGLRLLFYYPRVQRNPALQVGLA